MRTNICNETSAYSIRGLTRRAACYLRVEIYLTNLTRESNSQTKDQIEFRESIFALFRVGTVAFLRVCYTIDEMSRYFYDTMSRDGDSDIVLCRENSRHLFSDICGSLFFLCFKGDVTALHATRITHVPLNR